METPNGRPDALPCIRCGKQLKQVSRQDKPVTESLENQPYNGTAFYTSGHYGSTVFDEFHGETIEINVCDVCLLDAAKEQRVLYYRRVTRPEWTDQQFWVPDADEEYVREIDEREYGKENTNGTAENSLDLPLHREGVDRSL